MTAVIRKTDEHVKQLIIGYLNKMLTLLSLQRSGKNTNDLQKITQDLGSLNANIEMVYTDLRREPPLPSDRIQVEKVRRSLSRQECRVNFPRPWFNKQFFEAVVESKTGVNEEARASFIFEMLFAKLDPTSKHPAGVPRLESTDRIIDALKSLGYDDAKTLWQEGQIQKNIIEYDITGKSVIPAVDRLSNMTDAQLSDTLAKAIDDGLKDLKRRSDGIAKKHKDIETAFDRIEELWAKRPGVKFVQDQLPPYKKLDRYLFRSNIERFLRKFIGPEVPPIPQALPQNPVNLVKRTNPKQDMNLWSSIAPGTTANPANPMTTANLANPATVASSTSTSTLAIPTDYGAPETTLLSLFDRVWSKTCQGIE